MLAPMAFTILPCLPTSHVQGYAMPYIVPWEILIGHGTQAKA